MLRELHIAGLGVIEDVTLELSPGLNVLSGETGAGKTMVTVGLALVLGRRGQAGMVRMGAGKGRVEALFEASAVPVAREWSEDGQLVLARTISADGRSSARAGGQLSPLATLAAVGGELVELHGQNQAQRLLAPGAQLAFLDRLAGPEHARTLEAYRRVHARLRRVRGRLERLDAEARTREREKDLLAYQVGEIEGAGLRPGEAASLEAEASRLAHAERIREQLAEAVAAVGAEGAGADALRRAAAAAEEVSALDPSATELARRLSSLSAEATEATADLRAHAEAVDLDPARLEEVRERLAALRSLERKYGEGESGVLAYLEEARERLAGLRGEDDERAALVAESQSLEARATELAGALTDARRKAAPGLGAAIEGELRALGMEGASLEVRLRPEESLGPDGGEGAMFHFAAGPAQPPQPLARVASGGELSRTMLACRTVLADLDDVPTLVFDEVDAGIGGRAGLAVGRRLVRLARSRQVLVVTHLPQIACFADRHFRVTKDAGLARVTALEGPARVEELSRMLSGLPTEEAASHAEQLLAEAARETA
jgi:DNA repair protein RecN (Recombination protein N)